MSRPVSRRLTLAAIAAGCAIALGACGGGGSSSSSGSSSSTASAPAAPKPKQSLAAEIKPWNAALAAKSCEREAPFMFSIIRQQDPGAPATSTECPNHLAPQPPPPNARFNRAAEFGTGGMMEGPAGGDPPLTALGIWALDGDGHYRYTGLYGQKQGSEIDSQPVAGNDAAATVRRFVTATRERDCAALKKTVNPRGRLAAGTGGLAGTCDTVIGGHLFAPAVRQSPDAKPVELQLLEGYGFYGIAAGGDYFTIITGVTKHGDPAQTVFDVLPATLVGPAT